MFLFYFLLKNIKKVLDRYSPTFRKIILPIYWAFLTYMLLRPGVENQEYSFMFPGIDKILHFGIFGALGFFICISFPKIRFILYLQLMLAYALLTEILQETMGFGRSLEILDVVADMTGAVLAYYIYRYIDKVFFQN